VCVLLHCWRLRHPCCASAGGSRWCVPDRKWCVPHQARPLYPLAYGGVLQAVGLTRSREGAKGNAEVSGQRAFFEYEYEYRFTEYEYEGNFFRDVFCVFRTRTQSAQADGTRTRFNSNRGGFLAGGCPGGGNDRVCQSVISEASRGRESAGVCFALPSATASVLAKCGRFKVVCPPITHPITPEWTCMLMWCEAGRGGDRVHLKTEAAGGLAGPSAADWFADERRAFSPVWLRWFRRP
jgi:hypothetical protein